MKPSRLPLLPLLCAALTLMVAFPRLARGADGDSFTSVLSKANSVVVAIPDGDPRAPNFRILLAAGNKTDAQLESLLMRRIPPALVAPPLHGPFLVMLQRNNEFFSSLSGKTIELKFADGTRKSIRHEELEAFIKNSGNEDLKECRAVSKWFELVPTEQVKLTRKELRRLIEEAQMEQENARRNIEESPGLSQNQDQDQEQTQKQKRKERRQKRMQKEAAGKSA
jgi:hypothetical protein